MPNKQSKKPTLVGDVPVYAHEHVHVGSVKLVGLASLPYRAKSPGKTLTNFDRGITSPSPRPRASPATSSWT